MSIWTEVDGKIYTAGRFDTSVWVGILTYLTYLEGIMRDRGNPEAIDIADAVAACREGFKDGLGMI